MVVIVTGTGKIMRVTCCVALNGVTEASVTLTVNVKLPMAVGVPERTPPVLRLRPAGRLPLEVDQVSVPAPPAACSVTE